MYRGTRVDRSERGSDLLPRRPRRDRTLSFRTWPSGAMPLGYLLLSLCYEFGCTEDGTENPWSRRDGARVREVSEQLDKRTAELRSGDGIVG